MKNIEFVSISLDRSKNKDKWHDIIKSENLPGVQLLADDGTNSQFMKNLKGGIPRYYIIDPNLNIIDAIAPKPSNPDILKIFVKLLLEY